MVQTWVARPEVLRRACVYRWHNARPSKYLRACHSKRELIEPSRTRIRAVARPRHLNCISKRTQPKRLFHSLWDRTPVLSQPESEFYPTAKQFLIIATPALTALSCLTPMSCQPYLGCGQRRRRISVPSE